jgi:DNA invertase Pin-like site-specific DNA recombinase
LIFHGGNCRWGHAYRRLHLRFISQSENRQSKGRIRRWLTTHGHDLDSVQWFEDKETGATLQRPGLLALKEAIFAGTVKTVVVWKLDRLARSMREGINTLSAWCESGVRVVSVTQQIDLSGTVGHLGAGVLFAIAEIELQHTRDRQAASQPCCGSSRTRGSA